MVNTEGVALSRVYSAIYDACFENVDLSQCDWSSRVKCEHNTDPAFACARLCPWEIAGKCRKLHPMERSCAGIHKIKVHTRTHLKIYQLPWFPTCIISQAQPLCRVTIAHQISDSFLPPLHKNSEAAALLSSAGKLHILFKGKEHTLTRVCMHFLTTSYVQNCATPFNSFLVFMTLLSFWVVPWPHFLHKPCGFSCMTFKGHICPFRAELMAHSVCPLIGLRWIMKVWKRYLWLHPGILVEDSFQAIILLDGINIDFSVATEWGYFPSALARNLIENNVPKE